MVFYFNIWYFKSCNVFLNLKFYESQNYFTLINLIEKLIFYYNFWRVLF